jgi:hypothetical protein
MKAFATTALLLSSIFVGSCAERSSVGDVTGPDLAVAGNSGCYTVRLTLALTLIDDTHFVGLVTGDLEGTVESVGEPVLGRFSGTTFTTGGATAWHITGGIVPELIGETFQTWTDNRNILLLQQSLVRNVGSMYAVGGVTQASFTYTGETPLPPVETRLEMNGIICP